MVKSAELALSYGEQCIPACVLFNEISLHSIKFKYGQEHYIMVQR